MSTLEEVKAAEQTMRKAQRALMAYTDRKSDKQDRDLHRRLAAELKSATDNYVKTVLALRLNSK